jgi:hypothetical protein
MTDADVERSLRQWMVQREPASVPAAVRQLARAVPLSTSEPFLWRMRGALPVAVAGGAPRLGPVLALLGLLLAALAGGLIAGGAARPEPLTGVDRWRTFVVGHSAPEIEFRSVGGALSDRDDATLEFEDLVGSLVVMYFPDPEAEAQVADVGALAEATLQSSGSTAFIVAAPHEWSRTLNADPGVVTAEPPAAWAAATSERGPAILVVNRRGIVEAVFARTLPTPGQLTEALDGADARP